MICEPTPTTNLKLAQRLADFETLADALDYAAQGDTGLNFYSSRAALTEAVGYAELREGAIASARRLIALGVNPGDRVVLLADTCPAFMRNFLGCQYASAMPAPVAIPVIFGEQREFVANLRRQIIESGASVVIGPDALVDLLTEAAQGASLKFAGGETAFDALPAPAAALRRFGPDDTAYLQYSSGSTRHPRGVEVTQRAALSNLRCIVTNGLRVTSVDRVASWLPLYHDMGLVGFFLTPLVTQISVDYIATRDFARRPLSWLRVISENGCTATYSPSFGYELCARQAERADAGIDLSRLRVAGIGGDMVRPDVLNQFARGFANYGFSERAFLPSYGMAEATLAISFSVLGQGAARHRVRRDDLAQGRAAPPRPADAEADVREFVGCGMALPDHSIDIRREDGTAAGRNEVGRIFVCGPSLMKGYFAAPEATAEVLSADGWLDTGDLGFTAASGELVVTGRAKDLILINGHNVWPHDLEWAVEETPHLRRGDSAAFAIEDNDGADRVVVLMQCAKSNPAIREEIVDVARAKLRGMGISNPILRLTPPRSLPKTSSGKLSRAKARARFLAGGYDAPNPTDTAPTAAQ